MKGLSRERRGRLITVMVVAALAIPALGLAACGEETAGTSGSPWAAPTPTFTPLEMASDTLVGAGASFPYPLYAAWAQEYEGVAGVRLNYQSIGSGGGIEQIRAKTVDFGASDAPISGDELDAAGLVQFPMTVGGVVPIINVEGIDMGALKLSPDTLAKIFMGDVTKWNDAAIAADNGGMSLPDTDITVVHRSDSSGTSFIFTSYLSAVSSEWESQVGADKEVSWPTGIGGKGNDGVAATVQQVDGGIGYVEFAYAYENGMNTAQLKNESGNWVAPSLSSFQAAAANAEWEKTAGYAVILVDQPGDSTWPIVGASFILIYKEQADAARAKTMLDFFDWCYQNGQATAENLNYVPIPDNVVKLVQDTWTSDVTAGGRPVWQ